MESLQRKWRIAQLRSSTADAPVQGHVGLDNAFAHQASDITGPV